jgi:hypothetical protein
MTPVDPMYAPPAEPTAAVVPQQAPSGDPLGWMLLATPLVGGLVEVFCPLATLGTLVSFAALLVTVVLIGVDAHRHRQPATKHVVRAVLFWLVFYPVYMNARAKWGAPRRLLLAILVAAFFVASGVIRPLFAEQTRVAVLCKPTGKHLADGFDCSLKHTAGDTAAGACWDLVLTCGNGPGGSAHQCGHVAAKQTTDIRIEFASFTGAQACDRLDKAEVKGMVVTVE